MTMMKEVAKLIGPEGFDPAKMGYIDEAAFKQTADIAHQFGVIKKPADLKEAYTNEIMDMASK